LGHYFGEVVDKLVVYESNCLIEGYHELSLTELKVVFLCLARIDQRVKIDPTKLYNVSIEDYSEIYNVTKKHAYELLLSVGKSLIHKTIEFKQSLFNPKAPSKAMVYTNWVSGIVYNPDTYSIELRWSDDIIPFLSCMDGEFTRHYLEQLAGFSKIYSARLYRILNQYRLIGKRTMTEDDFRKYMGIKEGSYKTFDNLKRKVIEESVEGIRVESDLKVGYRIIGRGKGRLLEFKW
jgi:plasmid replication initiation protein